MDSCQNIESVDCELSVYRKGFLNVRLDLQRKLIVWKDSNHWSNNFIRSLTFSEVEQIRGALPDICSNSDNGSCSCRLQSAASAASMSNVNSVDSEEAAADEENLVCTWQMILNKQDQQWCLHGHNPMSESWLKLARTIEKISRLPVRL